MPANAGTRPLTLHRLCDLLPEQPPFRAPRPSGPPARGRTWSWRPRRPPEPARALCRAESPEPRMQPRPAHGRETSGGRASRPPRPPHGDGSRVRPSFRAILRRPGVVTHAFLTSSAPRLASGAWLPACAGMTRCVRAEMTQGASAETTRGVRAGVTTTSGKRDACPTAVGPASRRSTTCRRKPASSQERTYRHTKFAASSGLPRPVYVAFCGYGHSGRVRTDMPLTTREATMRAGGTPCSTHRSSAMRRS